MRHTALLVLLLGAAVSGGCGSESRARAAHADALAALSRGDVKSALAAAERAAFEGGERWRPVLDFVRGSASFARSVAAEPPAAATPDAVAALEQALVLAEDALAFWQRAATSREDWPAARRNVERALLRIEALRAKLPARTAPNSRTPVILPGAGDQPGAEGDAPPDPSQPDPAPTPGPGDETTAEAVTTDLPPDALSRLPDLLRTKDAEKQAARRARWAAPARTTERDW
jgi:hypothetical protein